MESEKIMHLSGNLADAVLMSNDPDCFTGKIQVQVAGRQYKTLYTKKFENRKNWEAPNRNVLKSIIPGCVTEVLVKEGDKVRAGDKLIVYEAMKMQNIMTAPFSTTIKSVKVVKGEKLPKGAVLIEFKG
ncbi:MAG: biotin/lipoyl-containing protein [Bacteroidia bacterium]|nr:biotin/lipoyl-containing protein [Bacteroidia bacterium]